MSLFRKIGRALGLLVIATLATSVVAAVVAFFVLFPTYRVRMRLTVTVVDIGVVKSGSSVVELIYSLTDDRIDFGEGAVQADLNGVAPTINLGDKGLLLLTFAEPELSSDQQGDLAARSQCLVARYITCLPFIAYGIEKGSGSGRNGYVKSMLEQLLKQHGPRTLPFVSLPPFALISQRGQLEERVIYPIKALSPPLADGVTLRDVTLELTDDAVTAQPKSWPAWLLAPVPIAISRNSPPREQLFIRG